MIIYSKLIRINQWAKNLFIFIPAFFAGEIFKTYTLIHLILGFLAFSFVASAIYILNDYRDIEKDRIHPMKRKRPLAAGLISTRNAFIAMALLLTSGLLIAYYIDRSFFLIIFVYLILNIGYSFGLKNQSILDILIIASGFLLRTISGGYIAQVNITNWLVIMVFLLALFLALTKRHSDILIYINSGKVARKSIVDYNVAFATSSLTMISAVIIVSYIMYTVSPEVMQRFNSTHLYYTAIFVIAGILRYLQITLVANKSESPTKVLYTDKFIIITLIGWILSFFLIIYIQNI